MDSSTVGIERGCSMMITYKNADGKTKYWKTESGAWNAANRLNEKETNGMWTFENEYQKGFYLEFKKDGE
jgi:hypothetical protein